MSLSKLHYIFGPVPSRRLGLSLGIDVIPKKICTLDCVYCEVGATTRNVVARREYVAPASVNRELGMALSREGTPPDWITFSGSGEPTLNSGLGDMIHAAKKMTQIPVAVITNGTLLFMPEVRHDLLEADAVLPSLDAASQEVFEQINRPHHTLRIERIIDALRLFRRMYSGQIWLEVLLVKGVNDREEELQLLREAIEKIHPDKIQLNTVVRPPAEPDAGPVGLRRMREIQKLFGSSCEIIPEFDPEFDAEKSVPSGQEIDIDAILALLRRRPVTLSEIASALGAETGAVVPVLGELMKKGLAERVVFNGVEYYV